MPASRTPAADGIRLDVATRTLPSGLTLIAVRNPGIPTFAAGVGLRVDARAETPDEEGLASVVGACLDEGTARRDAAKLAEATEALGAQLDGNASGGMVQCPATEAKKALPLLREIVVEPSFPAREVQRVQQEMLVDIRNELDDASSVAARMFRKMVYGKHRDARPSWGSVERIERLRPRDLARFHGRWFVPEGGVVAAAGPQETEEILDLLTRTFRGFRGELPDLPELSAPPTPRSASGFKRLAREQVHVFLGHLGVRRTHPDFHALMVMDHILGSAPGFTSRISRRLRDEQGLCYSVSASITSNASLEPGTFTAYIGTSPEHKERAVAGFVEEMQRIRDSAPDPAEVEDAHAYLTGSYPFLLQRSANLARYAVQCWRYGLGFDYASRRNELVRAVDAATVQRVARECLDPERVAIAAAGAA